MLDLRSDLRRAFPADDAFDRILSLDGVVYRELAGRRTLRFEFDGRGYFLKAHFGVGWREILKNLFGLRWPVLGARNEKLAIERLEKLGIETMTIAGYGTRGINPAHRQSFLITDELQNTVSLEDYCRNWLVEPPPYSLKKALLEKITDIARTIHSNGVNHRDFYLCHFHLQLPLPADSSLAGRLSVYLIDLHRVQLRQRTPRRWVVKDVAGLYFSSLDVGLSGRDVLRFMRRYTGKKLSVTLKEDNQFWQQVRNRAIKLYEKDFGRTPSLPI